MQHPTIKHQGAYLRHLFNAARSAWRASLSPSRAAGETLGPGCAEIVRHVSARGRQRQMLSLRFYSICSLHGKGCSQRRSGDTELAAVSEMVRDVTEKRRYDDFNHDANSPRTRRLLAMFLTQQRTPISFIRLKWIASSSQCSTRSCVTLTPAKRSTQMSCFQAARSFSKGLVSTEILRASRRKHHQCCSQTLPMRGSVAPAKSH